MDSEVFEELTETDKTIEKINFLMNCISNFAWMKTADENKIDCIFNVCLEIQEKFLQEEEQELYKEVVSQYYWIDFSKAVELFLESVIKNPHLNEQLTLYTINKYKDIYPKSSINDLLENVLHEMEDRQNLVKLIENATEEKMVDMEWTKINLLIKDITLCDGEECDAIVLQALRTQTQTLLNAIEYATLTVGHSIIRKVITCLQCQSDLKLWFALMKPGNMELVLKLCSKFTNFFESILKFFDRFAEEIECNYDEDLNVKYSHLNLDFDEFVEVLKAFLGDEKLNIKIKEFLENKIMFEEDSFLFWIDVNACLSNFEDSV